MTDLFDLFDLDLTLFFTTSIFAAVIFSLPILFIQCGSRKRSESRLSESRREGTTNVVAIGGGIGGAIQREQESTGENKEKSVQNSMLGKPKSKCKTFKSPQQQKTKTETPGNNRKTEQGSEKVGKKSESKTKQSEGKGKFGDTINDDTLNDTDCDWGGGTVVYKADRSKKKKRKN